MQLTLPTLPTPPSQAGVDTVPTRWINTETSTVYDWVVLAVDTLNEYGVVADEDNVYDWLKVNQMAPDISKPQLHRAMLNYSQAQQSSLGF